MSKTLYQKIWDSHLVREKEGENALLYIDLHLVHEVTSPQAFAGLRLQKRKVRCASKVLATWITMFLPNKEILLQTPFPNCR